MTLKYHEKSVADFVIQELIYAPTETMKATMIDPSVHELFCRECGSEYQNDHIQGCEMEIVQAFIAKHEYIIEQFVRKENK